MAHGRLQRLNDYALLTIFRRVRDEFGKYSRELLDSLYSDAH